MGRTICKLLNDAPIDRMGDLLRGSCAKGKALLINHAVFLSFSGPWNLDPQKQGDAGVGQKVLSDTSTVLTLESEVSSEWPHGALAT
jgi:hypothetical protein